MRTEAGAEVELEDKMELVSVEEANNYRLDKDIAEIYRPLPFLGYVFTSIKRKARWDIPTAAISADNQLFYNPRFMASLNAEQRKFVLLHEILHKIHFHFTRGDDIMKKRFGMTGSEFIKWRKEVENASHEGDGMTLDEAKKYYKKVAKMSKTLKFMNYCEDLAINQTCEQKFGRLPIGIYLDEVNKKYKLKMEAMREWEYYFKELEENVDDLDHTVDHDIQIGEGSGDGVKVDLTPAQKKEYEKIFNNICSKGAKLQKKRENRGTGKNFILSDILPDFDVKVNDTKVWKNLISKNFGFHRINAQETTLKRPSRRDDRNPWGKKRRTMNKHTVVILDTSGSCMDYIERFLGCIGNAMKKHKTTIDLLCTTTSVYQAYENVRRIEKEHIENVHSGGTDLRTAQQWITDNKPNGGAGLNVIVLTDGETPWLTDIKYSVSAIYTEIHDELPGVTNSAIIYDED